MDINMDINNILKPFDDLLKNINENKILLILVLILLGIVYIYNNNDVQDHTIFLFDNKIFKFTLFILITYISSSNPAIGIGLAIIMLVSLQMITYLKFNKEFNIDTNIKSKSENDLDFDKEKFSQIEPADITYLNEEYLTNPLTKINQLAPPINFNIEFTTPNDLYHQMINDGKTMLNDTYDLEKNLEKIYDSREQQIIYETKRNGTELVNSGLNRLQKGDHGEYNFNNNYQNNTQNKFIKYSNLMKNIPSNQSNQSNRSNRSNRSNNEAESNQLVNNSYNKLLYNYDLLVNTQLNQNDFDIQLEKVYILELELLQNIYKSNKNNYTVKKQKNIENIIKNIQNIQNLSKQDKKNIVLILEKLYLEMK